MNVELDYAKLIYATGDVYTVEDCRMIIVSVSTTNEGAE